MIIFFVIVTIIIIVVIMWLHSCGGSVGCTRLSVPACEHFLALGVVLAVRGDVPWKICSSALRILFRTYIVSHGTPLPYIFCRFLTSAGPPGTPVALEIWGEHRHFGSSCLCSVQCSPPPPVPEQYPCTIPTVSKGRVGKANGLASTALTCRRAFAKGVEIRHCTVVSVHVFMEALTEAAALSASPIMSCLRRRRVSR